MKQIEPDPRPILILTASQASVPRQQRDYYTGFVEPSSGGFREVEPNAMVRSLLQACIAMSCRSSVPNDVEKNVGQGLFGRTASVCSLSGFTPPRMLHV